MAEKGIEYAKEPRIFSYAVTVTTGTTFYRHFRHVTIDGTGVVANQDYYLPEVAEMANTIITVHLINYEGAAPTLTINQSASDHITPNILDDGTFVDHLDLGAEDDHLVLLSVGNRWILITHYIG